MNIRGFTLLELMLVSIIVLAMVAISTPLFRATYEDLKLTSSVKEMVALLHFCRERAVFERRSYRFVMNAQDKTYRVMVKDDKDNAEGFIALGSRWGRIFRLSSNIELETDKGEIDFFPSGSATQAEIYLKSDKGAVRTILVDQNTGRVKTYDHKRE